jgi:tRNA pseudouridine55 synthase
MDGILPIYKPVGMSSYDVIRIFKTNNKPPEGLHHWKVGHGGTLDPFAEGVLLLLLGHATKMMNELQSLPKTYVATAVMGASSDTLDCTGEIINQLTSVPVTQQNGESVDRQVGVSEEMLNAILPKFTGEIEQRVPDFSAAKIDGRPRYLLAREGKPMETKTKQVTIHKLECSNVLKHDNTCTLEATVSSGTYIRQLSYDIFKELGIESYLNKLVRTKIGDFEASKCASIQEVEKGSWQKYFIAKTYPAK